MLLYDAQYTPEQLLGDRKGWGHSSWLEGTRIAHECGVKQLVLFHHDPDNDDVFVDGLVEKARQEFPQVTGAAEGMEIVLPRGEIRQVKVTEAHERRRERRYQLQVPVRLGLRNSAGETHEAEGVVQDLSRSGIFFATPAEVPSIQPVELDVVLPDDVTHRGDMTFHFVAEPVRVDRLDGAADLPDPVQGVAARLVTPEEEQPEEENLPPEEDPQ